MTIKSTRANILKPASLNDSGDGYAPQGASAGPSANPLAETAEFFRTIREVLNVSPVKLALRLDTDPDVISALETARVDKLPPWPETERVVCNYARELAIDPRPALHILHAVLAPKSNDTIDTALDRFAHSGTSVSQQLEQFNANKTQFQQNPHQSSRPPGFKRYFVNNEKPSPENETIFQQLWQRLSSFGFLDSKSEITRRAAQYAAGLFRRPEWFILGPAIFVTALLAFSSQGWFVRLAHSNFPGPVASMVRSTNDFILYYTAQHRDGLRWIEVADPRTRRTDKLPVPEQED